MYKQRPLPFFNEKEAKNVVEVVKERSVKEGKVIERETANLKTKEAKEKKVELKDKGGRTRSNFRESILFLEVFQPFAIFRDFFSFTPARTYPLPPKTTVIGFLQNITQRYYDDSFWGLKVSIWGSAVTSFWNYRQFWKVGKGKVGKKTQQTFLYPFRKGRFVGKAIFQKSGSSDTLCSFPHYVNCFRTGRNFNTSFFMSPVLQEELCGLFLYIVVYGEKEKSLLVEESFNSLRKGCIVRFGRGEDVGFLKRAVFWGIDEDGKVCRQDVILERGIIPEEPKFSTIDLIKSDIKQKEISDEYLENFIEDYLYNSWRTRMLPGYFLCSWKKDKENEKYLKELFNVLKSDIRDKIFFLLPTRFSFFNRNLKKKISLRAEIIDIDEIERNVCYDYFCYVNSYKGGSNLFKLIGFMLRDAIFKKLDKKGDKEGKENLGFFLLTFPLYQGEEEKQEKKQKEEIRVIFPLIKDFTLF